MSRGGYDCARSALVLAAVMPLLAGCSSGGAGSNTPALNFDFIPKAGIGGVARMTPKNSSVTGTISFAQRGDKVSVAALIQELTPGPHRIFIHETGNCNSPNAASAGKVWGVPGQVPGKRLGDLPQIVAGGHGDVNLVVSVSGITVGDGGPNDVIGHSVVVHDGLNPDPRPEFGVANDWLACGVIEPK